MGTVTSAVDVDVHRAIEVGGLVLHINTIWATVVAGMIVLGFGFWVRRRVTAGVPGRGQLLCEIAIAAVKRQVDARIGPAASRIVPLALTVFFFVLISNWLALLPTGSREHLPAPTGDVNLTFAISALVLLLVHATAIRNRGLRRYLRHYVRPAWWLLPIKLIEEVIKPVTLALRLFGTVFSGTLMLILIVELFPSVIAPVPVVLWKMFELLIGMVQAFIFGSLTVLYFDAALEPEEQEAAFAGDGSLMRRGG